MSMSGLWMTYYHLLMAEVLFFELNSIFLTFCSEFSNSMLMAPHIGSCLESILMLTFNYVNFVRLISSC